MAVSGGMAAVRARKRHSAWLPTLVSGKNTVGGSCKQPAQDLVRGFGSCEHPGTLDYLIGLYSFRFQSLFLLQDISRTSGEFRRTQPAAALLNWSLIIPYGAPVWPPEP